MTRGEPGVADTLDVRWVPCAGKHELIFRRWIEVAVGAALVLINDHRPEPLRRQFEQMLGGCFEWAEIERPTGAFAVRLTRLRPDPAGFDPARIHGCGLLASASGMNRQFDDGILVVLQSDYREMEPREARVRGLRLAAALPSETELWVDLNGPDVALDAALTSLGSMFRGVPLASPEVGWRYVIRQPIEDIDATGSDSSRYGPT